MAILDVKRLELAKSQLTTEQIFKIKKEKFKIGVLKMSENLILSPETVPLIILIGFNLENWRRKWQFWMLKDLSWLNPN